jgi:transaldolase
MKPLSQLAVKIYGDGADLAGIRELRRQPFIKGFTTNPTLMRKAGVPDYEEFAAQVLKLIPDRPVSFEVLADDPETMALQARYIAAWSANVYVKIPVTNTRREPMYPLIHRLSQEGIQVNVTALLTLEQVREVSKALRGGAPSNVSIFAGRIADTGRDPIPVMAEAVAILRENPQSELIWASPRELLNIYHAEQSGCHIITVTNDVLRKLHLIGKDLSDYSLETVKMFYDDGVKSGYVLEPAKLVAETPGCGSGAAKKRATS